MSELNKYSDLLIVDGGLSLDVGAQPNLTNTRASIAQDVKHLLMESALWQAKQIYDSSNCKSSENQQRIQMHQRKISTVVASKSSVELYEGTDSLGKFDVVILAAPLQQAQIQFLVENPMGMDADTLHEMPLGGMKENLDTEDNPQNISGSHLSVGNS